jgi:ADP-heptose:LPS heptosyltransferase
MHLLDLPERIELELEHPIEPGRYLLEDVNAAHLLVLAGGGQMVPYLQPVPLSPDALLESASVLFMRAGGFGDLVLLTPVLRELKRRSPATKIAVCTMRHYGVVLEGLPYVDEIVPYPPSEEKANSYSACVFYENAVERNPAAEQIHITDLFAMLAGIEGMDAAAKLPEYRVKASEAIWANEMFPRQPGVRRVCIQVGTSSAARVYHRGQLGEATGKLTKDGWEVFLLGEKGEINLQGRTAPNLRNLADMGLSFRQSCAVLSTADAFLGSDSALLHVAGALAVPAVGLYGPFPWKLRTAYCPTTFAIQGTEIRVGGAPCSPCFHHVNSARRNHFPDHCPSKKKGFCEVLASITPDRIVGKLNQIAPKARE